MKWILSLGFILSLGAMDQDSNRPVFRLSGSYQAGLPDNIVIPEEAPRPSTPVPWNQETTPKTLSPVQPRLSLKTKVAIGAASVVGVVALGSYVFKKK